MKKLLSFICILLLAIPTPAAVVRGQDNRWYGDICVTQIGWQQVPWQLVGSICYSTMWRQHGFIANV